MDRRKALGLLASGCVGLFAGCSQNSTEDEERRMEPTEETTSNTTGESERTGTETSESGPTAPEPRFIVDESGNGDYESLQDAYRVASNEDVIGIEGGSYSVTLGGDDLDTEKSLTLVGAGRGETTVAIDGPSQEISMSSHSIDYWHLTAEAARPNGFYYTAADWVVNYSNFNIPTRGRKGTAQIGTEIQAYNSTFGANSIDPESTVGVRQELADTPLKIGILNATGCTFETSVLVQETEMDDCEFQARPQFDDNAPSFSGGTVSNCTFNNGAGLIIGGGDGFVFTQSVFYPGSDGYAFTIPRDAVNSSTSTELTDSTIYGMIGNGQDGNGLKGLARLTGNTFVADEIDGDYFIDGYGAQQMFLNVFQGADVRINSGDVSAYNEDLQVGNFYSVFDEEDEDGDGIVDLPRAIPGDGGITDQYPLAEKDLSQYET